MKGLVDDKHLIKKKFSDEFYFHLHDKTSLFIGRVKYSDMDVYSSINVIFYSFLINGFNEGEFIEMINTNNQRYDGEVIE